MTDNKENGLEEILELHQKEIWDWKQKESKWIKTDNQLAGCKKIIVELSAKIVQLKKDIDRLAEENNNIRTIDSSHQSLNGELQKELEEVKTDNKRLADQVATYREQLRKAGLREFKTYNNFYLALHKAQTL